MKQYDKFEIAPAFRSFGEARMFARSLHLKSFRDWREYLKGKRFDLPARPLDIPCSPDAFYRYHGWSGYPDFLGYPARWKFRHFHEARNFARSLGLPSVKRWQQYCVREIRDRGIKPADIPAAPNQVYKNRGWISWGDWLGNGMVEFEGKLYKPFEDARNFARSLGLKNTAEWAAFHKNKSFSMRDCPEDIPRFPCIVYKHHGWRSWEDFLGTNKAKRTIKYRDFAKARDFARSLRLKNNQQWREYCRGRLFNRQPKPNDIPQNPNQVYKEHGWTSWGDFLGTGNIASIGRKYRPFEQARDFVRSLKLTCDREWSEYRKSSNKPDDIPTNPQNSYQEEWQGIGDWLGTGNIASYNKKFRAFGKARKFVHKLKLKNTAEWKEYCKSGNKPDDIPTTPRRSYPKKWRGMGDWLGNGNVHCSEIRYLSYGEARDFVQKLGIRTGAEWRLYVKGEMPKLPPKPLNIPSNIESYYKDRGWISWGDFLGTGSIAPSARKYRTFGQARKFVRKLKLKNVAQWREYCKSGNKPDDIPTNPHRSYKGKWVSMGDWLSTVDWRFRFSETAGRKCLDTQTLLTEVGEIIGKDQVDNLIQKHTSPGLPGQRLYVSKVKNENTDKH